MYGYDAQRMGDVIATIWRTVCDDRLAKVRFAELDGRRIGNVTRYKTTAPDTYCVMTIAPRMSARETLHIACHEIAHAAAGYKRVSEERADAAADDALHWWLEPALDYLKTGYDGHLRQMAQSAAAGYVPVDWPQDITAAAVKAINARFGVDTTPRAGRQKQVRFKSADIPPLDADDAAWIERELAIHCPPGTDAEKRAFVRSTLERNRRYVRWVSSLIAAGAIAI